MAKTPTWQRAEGKNPKGGLNEKGRASLRAEGHDIKRPQPEGGSRRDSFCARMKGMKKKLTSSETANDPDSRINKSLRAWNCADGGAVDPYDEVQRAAKSDANAPYGVVDMGDKIIVGSPHGDQIPLSDELKSRIQDVAGKSGVWYEGTGGDIEQNKSLFPKYQGSWDEQVAKNVEGYPVEYMAPMFSNVEVNKPHEVYANPDKSIFDSIVANQDKAKYFKDRRFDADALRDFLTQGSEKDADLIRMSQLPATKENLNKFFSTGERLMWPNNWQEYPNRLGKIAKRFEESRNQYLLNAPPGVYVTGAGHIPELRGMNKDLKIIGGERASEADGGAVDLYDSVQQAAKGGPIWDKPRPKKLGKPEPLSSKEKASAKAAAKAAGRPYPNLIDNMRAAKADGGEVDPYEAVQQAANPDDGMSRFTPEDINRAAHGATPAVPPLTVTENPAPASSVSDAVRGAYNAAVPPTARLFAESAMGVHTPITERDFSPSDIQNMRDRLTEQQQFNAGREKNLQVIQDTMTPEGYRHYQAMTDQPIGGNEDYRRYMAHNAEALKTFQDTRGQTSVPYGTTFGKEDQPNQPLSVYSPEQGNFLTSLQRSYTDPGYRTGMTLGRFNVYDTPQGRVAVDNYDFRGRKQSWSDVAKNFQEQPFVTALRGAIPTAFPNIDRPVAVNLDKPGNYTYTGKAILTPGSHLEPEQTQTPKRDDIADYRTKTPGFHQFNLAAINSRTPDVTTVLPPRRPTSFADGGEVVGDKVQGDVQFLEDDPYAKVQEAAKLPMMAQNDFAMRMPQPEVRYDTGPQPGEATLKGYEPTIRERIYQGIAGTEERPSPERAQFARGMSQMAEFAPVLGNVMAGQEAQRRGDTKGMLMAALPVPGMATEARMAEAAMSPAEQAAKEAYQRVLNAQGLYSHAAEAAANLPQAKGSYEQMMAMLQKAGVKPEEMRWSGVEQFAGQPVTREQLATHFQENLPQIKETVYAAPDESKLDAADAEVRRILQAHNEANNPDTYQPRYYGQSTEPMAATPFFDTEEEARAHIMGMPERYRANMQILHSNPKPQVDIYETMRRLHGGEFIYNLPDKAQRAALNLLDERTALEKAAEESAPKFGQYTIPGGQNYREVLLSNPPKTLSLDEARKVLGATPNATLNQADIDYASRKAADAYKSSHWNEPNVLAHLRMSDRTGPQGEKILHLEELQSDWGQAGRKQGFKPELTREQEAALRDERNKQTEIAYSQTGGRFDQSNPQYMQAMDRITEINKLLGEGTVPKSPYVSSPEGKHTSSWVDLGLKRALREAAEKGYDKLVWTPGAEQASRYSLSRQVESIAVPSVSKSGRSVRIDDKDGNSFRMMINNEGIVDGHGSASQFTGKRLDEVVGKEMADKIMGINEPHEFSGEGLNVGGEGMKGFYDKILPTQLQKLVKKLDPEAKVQMGGHEVSTGKYQVFAPNGKMIAEYPHMESAQAIVNRIPGSTMAPVGGINAHSITITPKMREAILGGLPAYADGGEVVNNPDPYDNVRKAAKISPRARRDSH